MSGESIDKGKLESYVRGLTLSGKLVLYAIIKALEDRRKGLLQSPVTIREVYKYYGDMIRKLGLDPIAFKWVSDYLLRFSRMGLTRDAVLSRGRHGRFRFIFELNVDPEYIISILREDPVVRGFIEGG